MAKMGWKKGDGLGKKMDGITDCIQIKRRDENLGMGAEIETAQSKFKWNDSFWDDAYNQLATKFSATAPKGAGKAVNDDFDNMIEIQSSSEDEDKSDKDSDSESSFDGELIIEKSSKKLMKLEKVKEKEEKRKKVKKLDKSKAIKKEKKKSKKEK